MSILLRIPTKDQFGFVEVETQLDPSIQHDEIKRMYDRFIQTFQSQNKYSETTFNEILVAIMNSDITEWGMDAEGYQELTDSQKAVVQAIKRFKKRLPKEEEITIN